MGRRKFRYALKYIIWIAVFIYLFTCIFMRLQERESRIEVDRCQLYYMVNTDGMKGLGHSALLLVDSDGNGKVLSFNGMQRSLAEALVGKAGVGKMSEGFVDKVQMAKFLATGNLDLHGDQLQDNYDWTLHRYISEQEYDRIMEEVQQYVEVGNTYERLYAEYVEAGDSPEAAEYFEQMENMAKDQTLPLYQIYTHNCDTAAREIIATIDEEMEAYNKRQEHLTPSGNLKAFARKTDKWGIMKLGEDSFVERLLGFLVIF